MAGQVVQIIGSLLILLPFGLSQLGKVTPRSWSCLTFNLAGSAALAADAAASAQWGFLLLEGTWALVSLGVLCARVAAIIKGSARPLG
jgi:hypothetical protein